MHWRFSFGILVSSAKTSQAQVLTEGILEIDTNEMTWMHLTERKGSMAHTYYGSRVTNETADGLKYQICHFDFMVPIFLNGSLLVKLLGKYSLSISSVEGVYIGAALVLRKEKYRLKNPLGGFCVTRDNSTGKKRFFLCFFNSIPHPPHWWIRFNLDKYWCFSCVLLRVPSCSFVVPFIGNRSVVSWL